MATNITEICNAALGRIGAKRINNYETDAAIEAVHCRQHYEQARNALLESHTWAFARARATLSEDTETPAFEWDHQFILPADFLRPIELYNTTNPYTIEGQRLLTNDSEAELRYVRKVTDPTAFSALFVEALTLSLALRLVMPLAQDRQQREAIEQELARAISKAMTVNAATMEKLDLPQTFQESRGSWVNTNE